MAKWLSVVHSMAVSEKNARYVDQDVPGLVYLQKDATPENDYTVTGGNSNQDSTDNTTTGRNSDQGSSLLALSRTFLLPVLESHLHNVLIFMVSLFAMVVGFTSIFVYKSWIKSIHEVRDEATQNDEKNQVKAVSQPAIAEDEKTTVPTYSEEQSHDHSPNGDRDGCEREDSDSEVLFSSDSDEDYNPVLHSHFASLAKTCEIRDDF